MSLPVSVTRSPKSSSTPSSGSVVSERSGSEFVFGDYVSPNPKTIPLGNLPLNPRISYQVVKTENREKSKSPSANDESPEDSQETLAIASANENNFFIANTKSPPKEKNQQKIAETPLVTKVIKQQNRIKELEEEIEKLKLENMKLQSKKQKLSIICTPLKEEKPSTEDRRVDFNPTVSVLQLSPNGSTEQLCPTQPLNNSDINTRDKRDGQTPFKPRPRVTPKHKTATATAVTAVTAAETRRLYPSTPAPFGNVTVPKRKAVNIAPKAMNMNLSASPSTKSSDSVNKNEAEANSPLPFHFDWNKK